VDLADLAGLYLVLMKIPGKGHNKILTAAVGWGGAEMVLSHFYSLWFGARGAEFDWKYIQGCLDSNVSLVNKYLQKYLIRAVFHLFYGTQKICLHPLFFSYNFAQLSFIVKILQVD
jgi:hypothetical protein